MADNDEDLVSQVKVEGTEAAAEAIEDYADKAAAGFDKIADAAEKSSKRTGASITQMADDAAKARKAAADLQTFKPTPDQARLLKDIEASAKSFSNSLKPLGQSIAQFAQRMTILTAAATAAGGALVRAASNVAKAAAGTSDGLKKQTDAQVDSNNAASSARISSINYASSQRQLFQQLQDGKITYDEYNVAVKENAKQYQEQQRVAAEVATETRLLKEENERLQKTVADREAYNKLIETFGGPLTTALTSFGRQIEATRKQMVGAFGPGIAAGVDAISEALTKNAGTIGKFFDEAGKKLDAFVANNGPAIQKALENIGAAAAAVFTGLIDALPTLITFFNEILVPAVQGVVELFGKMAAAINAVFGTNITGGFIILITLLGTMTGAFKVLFGVLKTGAILFNTLRLAALGVGIGFGPFLLIIVAVGAALYLLATKVDWPAFWEKMKAAVAAVAGAYQSFKDKVVAVKDAIIQKWEDLVTWFKELPGRIGTFFTEMWDSIKEAGSSLVDWIIEKWEGLVTWFSELPEKIGTFFTDLWESVKQIFTDSLDYISNKVKGWVDALKEYFKPLLDMIKAVSGGAEGEAGGGTATVSAATGGHIRGPGTGTSDSIPAWLSNNEYVMKAKAVGKYGVGFMHAINSGRFKMPKFNMGGLVSGMRSMSPARFADGGLATAGSGNMRPLNLSILGEQFSGLLAPDDVADRMTKFAINRQTRSAGRKPSWVGGAR